MLPHYQQTHEYNTRVRNSFCLFSHFFSRNNTAKSRVPLNHFITSHQKRLVIQIPVSLHSTPCSTCQFSVYAEQKGSVLSFFQCQMNCSVWHSNDCLWAFKIAREGTCCFIFTWDDFPFEWLSTDDTVKSPEALLIQDWARMLQGWFLSKQVRCIHVKAGRSTHVTVTWLSCLGQCDTGVSYKQCNKWRGVPSPGVWA